MTHDNLPFLEEPIIEGVIAYRCSIDAHIKKINPVDFGLPKDYPTFDPNYYYITSGDAVSKARYMLKDLELKQEAAITLTDNQEYLQSFIDRTTEVVTFIELLIKARGTSCFFELDRKDHELIMVAKNPRAR